LACLPWLLSHHMFLCDKSHLQLHQCRPAILFAISTRLPVVRYDQLMKHVATWTVKWNSWCTVPR
jgi:hypothetical protein